METSSTTDERLIGRVKWFNNKAGYGFITITDGVRAGTDVFVHHSAVVVADQQYKYLVQGEYVEFTFTRAQSGTHEFTAVDVSGIKGGSLMCETRREFKMAKSSFADTVDSRRLDSRRPPNIQIPPRSCSDKNSSSHRSPRVRGGGPRDDDNKGWSLADKPQRGPTQTSRLQRQNSSGF